MTHPLTDETCRAIDDKASTKTNNWKDCMRAGADWQLEQVIEWMRDNLQDHRYSGIGILVDYVIEDFREAMRPTTKYEVISDDY